MKKYVILLLLILLSGILWRVFHFTERVYIFSDSARDILAAREALSLKFFPQTSAFSSAGPFVFGPQYMWLLMIVYAVIGLNSWYAFYYFLIAQSILFIFVMIKTSEIIFGKKTALLIGLLIAFSPRQTMRAMSLSQHSLVAVASAFALYFFVKYLKERKNANVFWCGFWIANAIFLHYQALGLLVFSLTFIFIKNSFHTKLKLLGIFILGVLLPSVPYLIWDIGQNYANTRNIIDYLVIGQYRIYVANRWLWHLFDFWPGFIADVLFGNKVISGLFLYANLILILILLILKKLNIYLKYIFIFFLFFFIYLRFYRGEKFEGYLIYLHPLIFITMSSLLFYLKRYRLIVFLLATGSFICSSQLINSYLRNLNRNQIKELNGIAANLGKKTGKDKKYAIYDFGDKYSQTDTWDISEAFVLYLDMQNKLDYVNGVKIGFCRMYCPTDKAGYLLNVEDGKKIYLLDKIRKIKDKKYYFVDRSPHAVFNEVFLWWRERPLKSSFNLGKFILERIPFL